MATYKVIQDVEAEDKLIGPLTLRQFIYAGVMALCLYLTYIAFIKGASFIAVFLVPVALMSGFFAFPWKLNQPTEVWALAKIRFILKPRQRKWDQSGIKELVVITAPKQIVTDYTKGLSQDEIQSRLKTLAKTIDSRGWSIKNSDNPPPITPTFQPTTGSTDRLIDIEAIPTIITPTSLSATEDMLDNDNSQIARKFDEIITSSANIRYKNIIDKLNSQQQSLGAVSNVKPQDTFSAQGDSSGQNNNWFVQPTNNVGLSRPSRINSVDGKALGANNQPLAQPTAVVATSKKAASPPMAESPYADILNLASNNDLNVATLARRVNLKQNSASDNEVVISLR